MNFKASFRFKTPLNKKTQRTVVNELIIGNLVDVYCLQLILTATKITAESFVIPLENTFGQAGVFTVLIFVFL